MKKYKKTKKILIIIVLLILLVFSEYSLGKSYQSIIMKANGEIAKPILVVENNPTIEMNGENEKEYFNFKIKNNTKTGEINRNKFRILY